MGPCRGKETGETALFRNLLKQFHPGDIFVADRYLCSYSMMALALGVDCVVRQHQLRTTDFRRGRRLGNGDYLGLIGWMWRLTSKCPNRSKFAKSKSVTGSRKREV